MGENAESEQTPLLNGGRNVALVKALQRDEEASSIVNSHVEMQKRKMGASTVGERLPYPNYSTIDWLHDLVKDSYRFRNVHNRKGLRYKFLSLLDDASGWIAAAIIGALMACVAFLVDVSSAVVGDYKTGYCNRNIFLDRHSCCKGKTPLLFTANSSSGTAPNCPDFKAWSSNYAGSYAVYVAFALVFGVVSASITLLTKRSLPAALPSLGDKKQWDSAPEFASAGKPMYLAAGSGIPEIKTILSGFVIPHYLDFKVLFVKAVGSVFIVATGMCLGKEGPFVHMSTCVGFLVASHFTKYRENGRKMREMLSVACASGLSVAFGAPIGGVLFSYEEISTHFPRKVLWRAFLCSLCSAIVLKALNPTGTGKLVLFETNYGSSYSPEHYLVFIFLGIAGGIWGGAFCKLNLYWSKWFRGFAIIKNHPVFEVFLIALATAVLQYPNPVTKQSGEAVISNLLLDCGDDSSKLSWVCQHEASGDGNWKYRGWLIYGTLVKLVLTIITFGLKAPCGVIIPALGAGAFFGRLVGQLITTISPGIFAMVGAAAFLAGVSRMTISLCVIMFELTGELEYVLPHMIAILVAKWTADAIGKEGVYDVAQTVLGHPFLDVEHCMPAVQRQNALVEELIPPEQTMDEIVVHVPQTNKVPRSILSEKLLQLKNRGLMDAGLVLVQNDNILQGYMAQGELEFGLNDLRRIYPEDAEVRLLGDADEGDFDMSHFVDRTPLSVSEKAPMEYAVELFGRLGLRYLMVLEEGTGRLAGVIIKKRMVAYLDKLNEQH